ncbi:hypothetical protein AB1K62_08635 [Parasphingorhabdus sp. JC815]|uniref:polysaccharide deacetylase family protein n=1 Tax=Parasphingorhabdus sp. JC815 TaxID=3232140 RepID=UPI00345A2F22
MTHHGGTDVLLTVDTELSAGLHQQGFSPVDNFNSSILGRCDAGDFGIVHQMECLDEYGHKGVFFVDPMPALVYGEQIIADIVGPIIERGHEVQLHIHTEWLEWAKHSPVENRQGRNLSDFDIGDQIRLLTLANNILTNAGAQRPTAFRAGNFGANDDSLRALHHAGLIWDSSFTPCSAITNCKIDISEDQIAPIQKHDIVELPVAGIMSSPEKIRPAQICALSSAEMEAAMDHASAEGHPVFVIVTHSFEMLSRDRFRVNHLVVKRLEQIAAHIAACDNLQTSGFAQLSSKKMLADREGLTRLNPKKFRTTMRMAEQLWSRWRFERSLNPV